MTRSAQSRSRVPGTASAATASTKGKARSGSDRAALSPVMLYDPLRPSAVTDPR
ncbi:hypothetical protein ABZ322_39420 [Streptomyces sp. NPDC006129]|uniref:hypothetical protein n=1 Tax=Streptomyces sp. NPDC006129 TaxID=3155348 RepID=UPI0033AE1C8C